MLALVGLGAFKLRVFLETGLASFFPPFASLTATQLFVDLCMSALVSLWLLARERKRNGRDLWPVLVTGLGVALLGSWALLLYLLLDAEHGAWPRESPQEHVERKQP